MSETQTPTTTTRARRPRQQSAKAAAAAKSDVAAQLAASLAESGKTSGGRSATGDRRPLKAVPAAPAAPAAPAKSAATPAPKKSKPVLGPAGYRAKFGKLSDPDLCAGIRAAVPELPAGVTDADLLAGIGWAYTVAAAAAKIKKNLAGSATPEASS